MKILVLGDIHGRTCWMDITDKESPDKIIFLGDYVSSHESISVDQQCSNLEDILNLKIKNPDKVILLRGNHDMQHLGYSWASCSGLEPLVAQYMKAISTKFLNNTQWIYLIDNIIFSHAGVSKTWFNTLNCTNVEDINSLPPSYLFGFTSDNPFDSIGESTSQPCTWIRPQSLIKDSLDNYIQVVGHTPAVKLIDLNTIDNKYSHIWLCDRLPNEYLIIEDGKFIPKEY